jgi:hypothetical protein
MGKIYVPHKEASKYTIGSKILWKKIEREIIGQDFYGYKNKDTHSCFRVRTTKRGKFIISIKKLQKEHNVSFKEAVLMHNKIKTICNH